MPRRRRHQVGMPDRQLDLLDPSTPFAPCVTPGWSLMPEQTRQVLTGLITRLLLDHAGGGTHEHRSSADEL